MLTAEQIEAASPEETREVLEKVFAELCPKPRLEDEPAWQGPGTLREPLYHHWRVRKDNFTAMLDCGAFVEAALMLVEPGMFLLIAITPEQTLCDLHEKPLGQCGQWFGHSTAATPALAIVSAIYRVKEADNG